MQRAIKITYFVHGTTTDNEKGLSSGWSNPGLSELGTKQSSDLRKLIKGKNFDVVFCSDLKRAIDSARLTFRRDSKIVIDRRLRECNYGRLNGAPSKQVDVIAVKSINKPFPEGESYRDVEDRISEFLTFLANSYAGKQVAIVAHKGPQLALDVLLKGKTWKEAINQDWRLRGHKGWRPGWRYTLKVEDYAR